MPILTTTIENVETGRRSGTRFTVTILGAVFVPLALLCLFFRPQYLLPLLILSSIFEAGSVINGEIGHFVFGVAPFYFVEILITGHFFLMLTRGRKVLPIATNPVRNIAMLLIAFLVWCVFTAFVMPRLFAGLPIYAPREGIDVELADLAPLQFTLSNVAQAGYLALNVVTVLYAIMTIHTMRQSKALLNAFYGSIFVVVAVGIVQRLVILFNGTYPYELFNNNPGYYQGFDQELGNFKRLTATFGEPSSAGSFLAAVGVGLLASFLLGKRRIRLLLATLIVLMVLIETTSTTGYAAFALTLGLLLLWFNPLTARSKKGSAAAWVIVLALILLAGGILYLTPGLSEAILMMTSDKLDTLSFVHRVTADFYALIVFKQTYGLGAGFGSNRASSLLMTLLSSTGVVGLVLFGASLYYTVRLFPGKTAPGYMQACFWSFVGLLGGQVIGVPDLNRPTLWAVFIVLITQLNLWAAAEFGTSASNKSIRQTPHPSLTLGTRVVPAT